MRREEMWRDRWARISVPDRALTIGTLRYNHVPCPPRDDVLDDARKAVGQSRVAMRQLQKAARKVHLGVKTMGAMESWAGGPALGGRALAQRSLEGQRARERHRHAAAPRRLAEPP